MCIYIYIYIYLFVSTISLEQSFTKSELFFFFLTEKFSTNIFFVKVSQTPNLSLIVQQLYQEKNKEVPFLLDEEDAVIHLEQFLGDLGENPILLILDDVWSGSESLIDKFNLQIPGHRVLVTSRFEFPRFGPRYDLEALQHEEAMTLFCHYAFAEHRINNHIPDDLLKKVCFISHNYYACLVCP